MPCFSLPILLRQHDMIFEKIVSFILVALPFSYRSLPPNSKLPFNMNAWSNDKQKLVKDLNGIGSEVQRHQMISSQI